MEAWLESVVPCVIIATGIIVVLTIIYWVDMSRLISVAGGDGNTYEVIAEYPDSEDAARLISTVNQDILRYLRYMRDKYLVYRNVSTGEVRMLADIDVMNDYWQPVQPPLLTGIVERLISKYNPEVITENRPGQKDTSYTVNKGKQLVLCIRDAKTHRLHDKSTIEFVVLHELAHMGNLTYGHDKEDFWPIFKFLLWEAVNCGIVQAVDYGRHPAKYCGIGIKYSPFYDRTLPNIWVTGVLPSAV